ncbi:MAG TPA: hypothetical protein PKJ27_10165, partial [Bacteroidales bacterium]|nr:hypothetical protein [Bacteroidales bacterium]
KGVNHGQEVTTGDQIIAKLPHPPLFTYLLFCYPLQELTSLLSHTPFHLDSPAFTYPLSRFPQQSLTPFPVSPRGERLLPMDAVAQFVI